MPELTCLKMNMNNDIGFVFLKKNKKKKERKEQW